MIVFDLRCSHGHVFEAWFANGAAFDAQREAGQVACPLCGDMTVHKAAMAPAVPAKSNRDGPSPALVKAAIARLAAEQSKALQESTWVGKAFPARARAMHAGDEAQTVIHGQATLAEAKAMVEDGIAIAPLPLPIIPPDLKN